jgi:hypothetical protein
LLAPESMADDGHGAIRRTGTVIGRSEHTTTSIPSNRALTDLS